MNRSERQAPRDKPKRMRIITGAVIARALIVLAAGAILMVIFGYVGAFVLDYSWRATGTLAYQVLFYFFSLNRLTLVLLGCLLGLVLFSSWVIRPAFSQYALFIRDSISTDGSPVPPVALPKELKPLEEEVNRINREMQLYKYAAREAEQRKDELVVYLAHDLRTPLTSVLGYLELLQEAPGLPEEQRQKYTAVALRKAQRMKVLVEELFEVTRFNVSQIELERTEVPAEMLMNQLTEEMQPELAQRGVAIRVENRGLGLLYADPEKLARALDNILHNALYYSKSEGVVSVILWQDEGGQALIRVSNEGADIPKEKLNRLFEKFYRGDEARQSHSGGTGLGLAIAMNILRAHGGSILAESGGGITSFTVVLPPPSKY